MKETIKDKYLITQAEYARKIGKTRARVNQMVRDGKLTVVYIGGNKLIKMSKHEVDEK